MKLTVVGCAPAWTRQPGRASSCYLVEEGDRAIVLDFGQGAFGELAGYRSPETIDGVLVSHLHADHLVDLVPLRHFLKFEAEARSKLQLHGPRELRGRFDAFQAEKGFLDALPGEALEPGEFKLAGLRIEARHVTHIPDSFAFRVSRAESEGPGLVYSGDCAVAEDLLPLLHEGDTLLCEAAFGAGPGGGGGHITSVEAARVAAEGHVARLILTHILDRRDERRAREAAAEHYFGELLLAERGLVVEVP